MSKFLNQKTDKTENSRIVTINGNEFLIPISPHDRYASRPDELEHMCFAQFLIWYKPLSTKVKKTENEKFSSIKIVCPHLKNAVKLPLVIHLKDSSLGSMQLRQFSAVLKFHKFREDEEAHEFFYSELMLYKHWRSEDELRRDDFTACLALYQTPSPLNPEITIVESVKNILFPEMDNVETARAILADFTDDQRPCHIGDVLDNQNK